VPEVQTPTYDDVVDVFQKLERDNETRPETKRRVYGEFLRWAAEQPARRRLPDDVLDAGSYAAYRLPDQYAVMPREYVQGSLGGGKPYDTRNWGHFTMRYAMGQTSPTWQKVWVGVFTETPRRMAEMAESDRQAREMLRFYQALLLARLRGEVSARSDYMLESVLQLLSLG